MTPQEFLKTELTILAQSFPQIHLRYGFDGVIDTHIVQVDPIDEYYNNEAFDNAWIPISMAFDEQFEESISFISSDSTLKLEAAEMEWNQPIQAITHLEDYNEIFAPILEAKNIQYITFGETEIFGQPKNVQFNIKDVESESIVLNDAHLGESVWFKFTKRPDLRPVYQKNTNNTQTQGFETTAMAA
jgi:hypothetical protein